MIEYVIVGVRLFIISIICVGCCFSLWVKVINIFVICWKKFVLFICRYILGCGIFRFVNREGFKFLFLFEFV